jgi:transposase-like protein
MEFMGDFPDDATCLNWLWRTRYSADGEHALCPKCEVKRPFKRYGTSQQRQSWTCTTCGNHLHPTAGTIFHKSSTSLHLWFYAMYLMTSTRCGISAKQLERELGVTYKTAWRMFTLIRNELMTQGDDQLSGNVEMDETYVGGKTVRVSQRQYHSDGRRVMGRSKKKTTVFGAVERGGRVRAEIVPAGDKGGIPSRATEFVLSSSEIFTDEYVGYDKPGEGFNRASPHSPPGEGLCRR